MYQHDRFHIGQISVPEKDDEGSAVKTLRPLSFPASLVLAGLLGVTSCDTIQEVWYSLNRDCYRTSENGSQEPVLRVRINVGEYLVVENVGVEPIRIIAVSMNGAFSFPTLLRAREERVVLSPPRLDPKTALPDYSGLWLRLEDAIEASTGKRFLTSLYKPSQVHLETEFLDGAHCEFRFTFTR